MISGTLKRMGIQLSRLLILEVLICTQQTLGLLDVKSCQTFSPIGILLGLAVAGGLFAAAPAYAASDQSWDKMALAKKVIENVSTTIEGDTKDKDKDSIAEDFIQKPLVVDTEITLEPVRPVYTTAVAVKTKPAVKTAKAASTRVYTDGANHFPYGYCTYYVAGRRTVVWSGNAGTWLANARAVGFPTGEAPKPGSIMVTSEGRVGHVAYVESVNGDQITISEMNYKGFGVISSRIVSIGSRFIKGFIY